MKTAVIYYSWSGHTKRCAQQRAQQENAEIFEVKDLKCPGPLKAYTVGCLSAMKMKRTPIEKLDIPMEAYDKLIIMAPIWAGHTAPAINHVFDALPPGKSVIVCGVSASGTSRCREKVEALVRGRKCEFIGFEDRKP